MKVLATTTIVGDVVRQVAGETVQLDVLLPAGVDEHSYQYTPADVAMAARADLIVINGAGLEPFVTSLLESAGGDARLVSLSEGIHLQAAAPQYPEHEGMQGGDPHVWTVPNNVSIWVERIAATLSEIDPQSAHVYQQNAETYRKELRALDDWIIQQAHQGGRVRDAHRCPLLGTIRAHAPPLHVITRDRHLRAAPGGVRVSPAIPPRA